MSNNEEEIYEDCPMKEEIENENPNQAAEIVIKNQKNNIINNFLGKNYVLQWIT